MCDVAHKVMRMDTVHDLMKETHTADRSNFQNNFKQKALGLTVLTAYNNKTYRIDDIDFEKSPMDTFDQRGTKVTLKDYYRTVSGLFLSLDLLCVCRNHFILLCIFKLHFRNTTLTSEMKSSHC